MSATPLAFSLRDMAGETRQFPTGRPSLICFVKEDCNTCNLTAPVLEAFHQAWGDVANIWMLGQTADGNAILKDRHGLTLPILDDSALRTSLAWGFEIVPAVFWVGADGAPRAPLEGFVRQEWEALARQIAAAHNGRAWGLRAAEGDVAFVTSIRKSIAADPTYSNAVGSLAEVELPPGLLRLQHGREHEPGHDEAGAAVGASHRLLQ